MAGLDQSGQTQVVRCGRAPVGAAALSRRELLKRGGGLAALVNFPLLASEWPRPAAAALPGATEETLLALIAFILPGDDPYSVAQGHDAPGPGGVASGALRPVVELLDGYLSLAAPGIGGRAVPLTDALAAMLNRHAAAVDPAAALGRFRSPYANLSWEAKGEVFRRVEEDEDVNARLEAMQYVAAVLIGVTAAFSASEQGVFDRLSRSVSSRPVGWKISGYAGPAEGYAEYSGYYRGSGRARTDPAIWRGPG